MNLDDVSVQLLGPLGGEGAVRAAVDLGLARP